MLFETVIQGLVLFTAHSTNTIYKIIKLYNKFKF